MLCDKPVLPAGLHTALKTLEEKYAEQIEDDEQIVMLKDQTIEEEGDGGSTEIDLGRGMKIVHVD